MDVAVSLSSRREFFARSLGFAGLLGVPGAMGLGNSARAAGQRPNTSLILLWQDGGPSPFETFDPKPAAPLEYRGELGAIQTSLPGVQFCEVLPRLAKLADRLCIVRSLHQPHADHPAGSRYFITGHAEADASGASAYPDLGAVIHRLRSDWPSALPQYVATGPYAVGLHRGGPAYLGPGYQPFAVKGDPSATDFRVDALVPHDEVSPARLRRRLGLLSGLDRFGDGLDPQQRFEALERFHQQAANLLANPAAATAFDLSREDPRVRERYGYHSAGQQALLARRLIEAGASVVAVRFSPDGRGDGDRSGVGWDDHAVHGNIFRIMQHRGPLFDQAVATLIEDLTERGLDQQVLLVVAGEFGRTPRIAYAEGETFNTGYGPGRDHWAGAGCALVFGGGMPMGQVIGATNRLGEYPIERPLQPQDLLATIYQFLGIDPNHQLIDRSGRPIPLLPFGTPLAELNG